MRARIVLGIRCRMRAKKMMPPVGNCFDVRGDEVYSISIALLFHHNRTAVVSPA